MERYVKPEGSLSSKLAFVGEAPAYEETLAGRPFVGKSGQQFNDFLLHCHTIRSDHYITNLFKEIIQKKRTKESGKNVDKFYSKGKLVYSTLTGFMEEGQKYVDQLKEELSAFSGNCIVPMGNPACEALTGKRGIVKWRGSILYNSFLSKKIVPTIHPAASMRNYLYRYQIIHDFKRGLKESEDDKYSTPHNEVKWELNPTLDIVSWYLKEIIKSKKPVAVDIECPKGGGEITHISLTNSEDYSLCIPFIGRNVSYWTLEKEQYIWNKIAYILENLDIPIVGQNLEFDTSFLYEKYGIVTKNIHDTLIAHRIIYPDLKSSLAFICSTKTRMPYYKEDGKNYMTFGGNELDFQLYNAKDSWVCIKAMPDLLEDLKKMNNMEAYEVHRKLIEPCNYMGYRGLKVDIKAMENFKSVIEKEIEDKQEALNSSVGFSLNVRSTKQLIAFFYVKKGYPPYKYQGKMSVNEKALIQLARKGSKEAKLVLEVRKARNKISKFLETPFKNDRFVCSYKPITGMGRLASSKDIFGYGDNHQNRPKWMNQFYLADEDHLIYEVDLSQADARSVAFMAPEPKMMKAFNDKIDIHSKTASELFGIPYDEIIEMHKKNVKCDLGYGDKTHRAWGKQCNYALNFGMGIKKFSLNLEIPESQGKFLHNKYHKVYPGVQQSYQKGIQNRLQQNGRILENAFGRKYLFLDRWGDKLFDKAYAFPAQSNTADIINRWGIIPLYYDTERFGKVEILRQVHDSINFQIPISAGINYHTRVLKDLRKELEQELKWKLQKWVIPADFTVGRTLNVIPEYGEVMKDLDLDQDITNQLKEYF